MHNLTNVTYIQNNIIERLRIGESIDVYIDNLLMQSPKILLRLLEDHSIDHPVFTKKILQKIETLEQLAPPADMYVLLCKSFPQALLEILEIAIERHDTELWVVEISRLAENTNMGYMHLLHKEKNRSRDLAPWCMRYAMHGAKQGLIAFAAETGNPIPASALCRAQADADGIIAAVEALRSNPKSPVLAFLAATIGPNIKDIVYEIAKHFSAENLPESVKWWME